MTNAATRRELPPSGRRALGLLAGLIALAGSPALAIDATSPPARSKGLDFSRDIRPILSDKCFACHGPDDSQRKAGLRLDTAEGATRPADSGSPAIVPGKLDEGEFLARITSVDPEEVMPPPKHGKPVIAAEVERLKAWIAGGASYRQHWAFVAPTRPAVPVNVTSGHARNPIDAFVLARLAAEGMSPAPEADRAGLLRRLSLDLIGLPPTIAELDAFLADGSTDAYEKQVDRLLGSPHYGERWGRIWLDAARYADSDGYEKDKPRSVWAYRDWVIAALNRDLPYDQFIIDQVAGDLLPGASQERRVATGFLRNSMINEEGGADPEQFRMEAMFDRMDALGKGVLGLTIQCAQCHTHKYDPITHDDYYRMFAFLNNANEANIPIYSPDEQRMRADLFRAIVEVEEGIQHRNPDWPERMARWEESVRGNQPEWAVIRPEVDTISTDGCHYVPMPDGSMLPSGYAPTKHTAKLVTQLNNPDIAAIRLELLNDPNLPLNGPGRSTKGTGALTDIWVESAPADQPDKFEKAEIASATADINLPETPLEAMYQDKSGKRRVTGPIEYATDGKEETAWGHDVGPARRNLPRKAVFVLKSPIRRDGGTILRIHLRQDHGGWNSDDNQNYNLGRIRVSVTADPKAQADPLPSAVREAIETPPVRRTPAQVAAIFGHWRTTVPDWKEANDRIEGLWRSHPEGSPQLVLADRATPRATFLLERGDFLKPSRRVEAGVPGFLHPLPPGSTLDRLAFARWLVDRRSPTTARSFVNRAWQAFFGMGIVGTSEDLGSQSEAPSHPELLDWLAVEFMDGGWSPKALHRLIVTSGTYRQSSRITPEGQARDPYNRLLARGPRFRVDAEVVHDIALAASGRLDPVVGGPSVHPPAPEFLFQPPTSYGPKVWKAIKPDESLRRAIYTFRFRSVLHPALQAFDAPNGDFSCVRRARSNTPLQALTTLNEPVFLDCARSLALKTLGEGGGCDADRLAFAFRRCVSRSPTDAESGVLLALLRKQVERSSQPDAKPWALASANPDTPPALPEGTTPAQLAAWTAVSRILLNLDETITKE